MSLVRDGDVRRAQLSDYRAPTRPRGRGWARHTNRCAGNCGAALAVDVHVVSDLGGAGRRAVQVPLHHQRAERVTQEVDLAWRPCPPAWSR